MPRKLRIILILLLFSPILRAQTQEIRGKITDKADAPLFGAIISAEEGKYSTLSDTAGHFRLTIPADCRFLLVQYQENSPEKIDLTQNPPPLHLRLEVDQALDAVIIDADKVNAAGNFHIDAQITDVLPSISEGVESLVQTELGVSASRNELSAKYSVRGGSFDENLVYVNGIEIYRPQLVRAGRQEGLSFINPKLVSNIHFSSGGFEARYGGKMSSVLDITYKKARKNELSASIGLLGGDLHYQGKSKNGKFTHTSGIRYKSTSYLLKSLPTKGAYKPVFSDFQTYLTYEINPKTEIRSLSRLAYNQFDVTPQSGESKFGNLEELYALNIAYEGQEKDKHLSAAEMISLHYQPKSNWGLQFTLAGFAMRESEALDIIGYYNLNELNTGLTGGSLGDSIAHIGYGSYMSHARNRLEIIALKAAQSGYAKKKSHHFRWGILYENLRIKDHLDEWTLQDSAGYIHSADSRFLELKENIKGKDTLQNNKLSAYIQDTYSLNLGNSLGEIIAGLRLHYGTLSRKLLLSPRLAFALQLPGKNAHTFRISGGIYRQPLFYKEMRTFSGKISSRKDAQMSLHCVLGHNFRFRAYGRNFKLYTELYYKYLPSIIPFEVENIRLRYYADQRTSGYASGIDIKLLGDFVPGINSWFTLSLMQTKEKRLPPAADYIPRPTDRRISANLFVQDYIPGYKQFKVHLNFVYGSGFPFGYPGALAKKALYRSSAYNRVDVGISASLLRKNRTKAMPFFRRLHSLWITAEIFNLLDIHNTVSYRWVQVVPNISTDAASVQNNFPVPVELTGRRYNIKLSIKM